MKEGGKQADFVLCIGDDRSDEDMFENIADIMKRNMVAPRTLFACTVGQKPSKAKFYLDDTFEVVTMLSALADATEPELGLIQLMNWLHLFHHLTLVMNNQNPLIDQLEDLSALPEYDD